MEKKQAVKIIAKNKKALHDYFVLERFEAGISLAGTEVKSIRQGKINLKDCFCAVDKNGELVVHNMHISHYEQGNIFNHDPVRPRVMLMHRQEIRKLFQAVKIDGMTLIPLAVYLKGPRVKVELGICKGKKLYDKRESAATRDAKRDMDRAVKLGAR